MKENEILGGFVLLVWGENWGMREVKNKEVVRKWA